MAVRRGFPFPLLKVLLLAAMSIGACIWGLARAYRPRAPMVVPVTPVTPALDDAGPGEITAPELLPEAPATARPRE